MRQVNEDCWQKEVDLSIWTLSVFCKIATSSSPWVRMSLEGRGPFFPWITASWWVSLYCGQQEITHHSQFTASASILQRLQTLSETHATLERSKRENGGSGSYVGAIYDACGQGWSIATNLYQSLPTSKREIVKTVGEFQILAWFE